AAGAGHGAAYQGLVRPTEAERALNGERPRPAGGRVDPEQQVLAAAQAFVRQGFLVLAGDRHLEQLDAAVHLRADTEVCFLKLVPLVGAC
ncbi:hypothetical protein VM98_38005, partial [Streptomyces rubellomurinus subsp. indigoferus]